MTFFRPIAEIIDAVLLLSGHQFEIMCCLCQIIFLDCRRLMNMFATGQSVGKLEAGDYDKCLQNIEYYELESIFQLSFTAIPPDSCFITDKRLVGSSLLPIFSRP